jgi:mannosyltransferase
MRQDNRRIAVSHDNRTIVWPVAAATLAAFALRVGLAHGDLWGDEAASTMLSLRPLGEMLRTLASAEPHPPLFPLLLKAWIRLAGTEEVALRFPSIAAGTLAVPVAAALGRDLGPRVGATAALLVAISPFLLWYTTEARMYGLAALGAALSFFWFLRLLRRPSLASVVGYGLTTGLALLTHYFVLFVGLAEALVGLAALFGCRRLLGPLAAGAALALLPAAIWGVFAARIVGSYYGAAPGTVDLLGVAGRAWLRLAAGWSVEPATASLIGLAATPLLVGAAALTAGRGRTGPAWLAWLLTPFAAGMAVSLVRPMYQERYLAVVAVAYLLLAAVALAAPPSRALRAALLALAVGAAALPIGNLALGRYVRSQYGSHAAEANALALPGEAAILTGPSQAPLYDYYASQGGAGLPVVGLPRGSPAPEPATQQELAELAERYQGLWLFLYAVHDYDPADVVERWLTANAYRAPARWTVNGRLIRFATERGARLGSPGSPRALGEGWRAAVALPTGPVAAGALLPLRVELEPLARPTAVPKLRLRLTDERGFIWGEADELVGAGFLTVDDLGRPGRRLERRAVAVLAGAPTGQLRLEAQLYQETPDGARPLGTADLGAVSVAASDRFWPGQLAGFQPLDAPADAGWRLLGWAGSDRVATGARAYLTTVWRAEQPAADLEQIVRLVGPAAGGDLPVRLRSLLRPLGGPAPIAGADRAPPAPGAPGVASTRRLPLPAAPGGTVRRLQIASPIGAGWSPGDYRVELGLRGPADPAPAGWRVLGRLRVDPGAGVPAGGSEPRTPVDALFGDAIRLRGYTLAPAEARLTLHWAAEGEVDRGYSVFVHLLDPSGAIRAQADGAPAGGSAPTDGWSTGDRVDDPRALVAPPGTYRLRVGLYDPSTGRRLALSGGGDYLDLGEVALGR